MPRRIAIIGGGISGLGAAWALHHHPDRFDFRLFEAQDRIGGNAITADMPQDDGNSIPFDISVTACIPSVYQHILLLMKRFGIELIDTRFSYSVKYRGRVYAHDFDSDIRDQLQFEIAKFQRVLRRLHWFGWLSRSQSKLLKRPQSVQLHQHGDSPESDQFFRGLQVQGTEAHVRQLPHGDKCVRYACGPLYEISRILRYRNRHPHADLGPGNTTHLREPVRQFPRQDIPQPACPKGVPPIVPRRGRGRGRP